MSDDDYYKILGINKDASKEEIKAAYKKQAKKNHPDMPNGSHTKQIVLNEAYSILIDMDKRKNYDEFGNKKVNIIDIAKETLKNIIENIISEYSDYCIETKDIQKEIKLRCINIMSDIKKDTIAVENKIKKIDKLINNFNKKNTEDKSNWLFNALEEKKQSYLKMIIENEKGTEIIEYVVTCMDSYNYKFEKAIIKESYERITPKYNFW